jgi:putative addiction module component (TIGR02574 family)
MTRNTKAVLEAALALPQRNRAEIAERLIRSLDGPEPTPAEQAEIDAVWSKELERRLKSVDDGTAELIPYEEVMADVWATLKTRSRRKKKP